MMRLACTPGQGEARRGEVHLAQLWGTATWAPLPGGDGDGTEGPERGTASRWPQERPALPAEGMARGGMGARGRGCGARPAGTGDTDGQDGAVREGMLPEANTS